jgi:uncharacterized heparinase superfamily protein
MHFLGKTRDLDSVGWDDPSVPLLWRYNQHYFDDLNARSSDQRLDWHRELIDSWIADNPPGRGTGWSPYPTSLRIVNWIKAFCRSTAPLRPDPAWLHSLAIQVRWLANRLEWHLLGNHLFANAKALTMAGLYFQGEEAGSWLALGQRLLLRELPEQVLPDGGQFERSPMYHALAVEDVLDLLNALQAYSQPDTGILGEALCIRLPGMLHWLQTMSGPNGRLTRFNDCSDGIAPDLCELQRYALSLGHECPSKLQDRLTRLEPTGYARLQGGGAVVWLDIAPIGPDYLPGHAHADTLSFEMAVRGRMVLVNRGTSVYGTDARRLQERGTAAHNTAVVAGNDSSEIWSGFRVGRRAHVEGAEITHSVDGGSLVIGAHHDGFKHLPGCPIHRRTWIWSAPCDGAALANVDAVQADGGTLIVHDEVRGGSDFERWAKTRPPSEVRFHLAPDLTVKGVGAGKWEVADHSETLLTFDVGEGSIRRECWEHAAGFGDLRTAETLVVTLASPSWRSQVRMTWGRQCTYSS